MAVSTMNNILILKLQQITVMALPSVPHFLVLMFWGFLGYSEQSTIHDPKYLGAA